MGSKRKRLERKKDFQKTKLKVGNSARKPDNHTDTSFKAKQILLPNQSIASTKDLAHSLLLVRHHSATARKEALVYIQNNLPSNPSHYKQIITATIPLITDQSQQVRTQLVAMLAAAADKQAGFLALHINTIVLYVHAAMTHIAPEIRASLTLLLSLLLDKAPQPFVKAHFVKTLRTFFPLMAWSLDKDVNRLAAASQASLSSISKRARPAHLATLRKLLAAVLEEHPTDTTDWTNVSRVHPNTHMYMVAEIPQAAAPYRLFDQDYAGSDVFTLKETELLSTEDLETRCKIMTDIFAEPLRKNLHDVLKEGNDVAREAKLCLQLLSA